MAASIGLGERDSRRKTSSCDLVMFLATFSGTTDTRSDVARICAADKNGARIAVLGQALISAAKKPLITDRLAVLGLNLSLDQKLTKYFGKGRSPLKDFSWKKAVITSGGTR